MGTMRVWITIKAKKAARVSALVDTRATFTVIPRALAEKIQLATFEGLRVKMADGRMRQLDRASALITLSGRKVPATVLVTPNGGDILLGAETLETLGMSIDPRRRRLKAFHSATIMAA